MVVLENEDVFQSSQQIHWISTEETKYNITKANNARRKWQNIVIQEQTYLSPKPVVENC